ncbi:MAG: hypothetical protein U9P80_00035, partial [Thermodesulfobacteriota bacterium]|nr:hypothetical protein [Thermodesulfobacteriota bacterium]
IPTDHIVWLRSFNLAAGILMLSGVYIFNLRIWGKKTAIYASLLFGTSLGFISVFGTVNTIALPSALIVLAVMGFIYAYLNDSGYFLAYLLAAMAMVTGGWVMAGFFLFCIIGIVLMDLSPQRFLGICPIQGLCIFGFFMMLFYLVLRIAGGPAYVPDVLSAGKDQGLFKGIWLVIKYNLPWIPLLIPAWLFSTGEKDKGAWQKMLPVKIALVIAILVLCFSAHIPEGYALLSVPFGATLGGYWIAEGMRSRRPFLLHACMLVPGAIAIACGLVLAGVDPLVSKALMPLNLCVVAGFLVLSLVFIYVAKRQRYTQMLILGMVSVFAVSWTYTQIYLPERLKQDDAFATQASAYSPLLVFNDDLYMRGYTGIKGNDPVITGRNMVPVCKKAYLAASTSDPEGLAKRLGQQMEITPLKVARDKVLFLILPREHQ